MLGPRLIRREPRRAGNALPGVEMLENRLLFAKSFAIAAGDTGDDRVSDIGADRAGNIYVVGSFQQTVDFDPRANRAEEETARRRDIFLAKYSPTGKLLWEKKLGGQRNDFGNALAVRPNGTVAIVGRSVQADRKDDALITVFKANGNRKWQQRIEGANHQYAKGVAFTSSGDIVVTGGFDGRDIDIDGTALENNGRADVFVARFSKKGDLRWAQSVGGSDFDYSEGIAVDDEDNVIISGSFFGQADFDPSAAGEAILQSTGVDNECGYVLKLDADGDFVWVRRISSADTVVVWDVAVDGNDDAVVVVDFVETVTFGDDPGASTLEPGANGNGAGFAKINSDGDFVWVEGVQGGDNHAAYHVAIDEDDDIYLTGLFDGTPDFDPGAGSQTASSVAQTDEFILKLTTAGDFVWVQTCARGNPEVFESREIAVDSTFRPLIGGRFVDTFSLSRLGSDKEDLTSAGGEDILILKLKRDGQLA